MQKDEHKVSLKELYRRLNSSVEGLTIAEAKKRQKKYGANVLEEKKKTPLPIRFAGHLFNFFAILLWIGAILAYIAEQLAPHEGYIYISIALASVVILNAVFTFVQEYQSEKIMESFKKLLPAKVEVLRNNKRQEILAKDLVPGDIIFIKEGDKIPADCRLTAVNQLKIDGSALTGESQPQFKKIRDLHKNILYSKNMVFSGTSAQSGNGTALVYATGMDTQIGRIVQLTKRAETIASPLKKQIDYFIKIISGIAVILGITFFIISILIGDPIMASLIFAIGIIVANVPEGLLPTVTLTLSIAARKMAKQKALLKNLEAVETLGSTTVICTDKTGTITENKIVLNTLVINLEEKNAAAKGIKQTKGFDEFLHISVLCNNAQLKGKKNYLGDPIEGALLLFANKFTNIERLACDNKRTYESPFSSESKHMVTVCQANSIKTAYLKGAPEVVLAKCDKILLEDRVIKLTEEHKQRIAEYYKRLAERGEKVLAMACQQIKTKTIPKSGFVFTALAGMHDPPRKEIPQALAKCKSAGIKVIMVTGDYSVTAEAIARHVGMIEHGRANIMTGEELNKISNGKLQDFLCKKNLIFARISPLDKMKIVKALQEMGGVVTVTGDGVNDAPALKHADMGVAMGIIGTEVAKEAADMVLLDDNFATIVKAVAAGRTVYDNIRRFIAYILTSNIPEILPFIAFVLLGIPLPLTVVLILAIDLGTDLLPALGLGAEKPESDIMKRPPRSRKERLLDPLLLFRSYGIIGMLEAAAGFFAFFIVLYLGGWKWSKELAFNDPLYLQAVSAFFASTILCQIPNVLICRTKKESIFSKGIFTNKLVLFGIASELILLAIILYNPFSHKFFSSASLSLFNLSLSLPFVLLIFFGDEFRKWLFRKNNQFVSKYLNW